MKIQSICTSIFLLICCSFTAPVFASTPDGSTPAQEIVCNGLNDSQFGICNAYCEAMDCDSGNPKANEKACINVFKQWTKEANTVIPCEAEPAISLAKSIVGHMPGDSIPTGTSLTYQFEIANVGDGGLVNVVLTDPMFTPADLVDCTTKLAGGIPESAPLVTSVVTCTAVAKTVHCTPGNVVTNTATVTAESVFPSKDVEDGVDSASFICAAAEPVCPANCVALIDNLSFPDNSSTIACVYSPTFDTYDYTNTHTEPPFHEWGRVTPNTAIGAGSCTACVNNPGTGTCQVLSTLMPLNTVDACQDYLKSKVAPLGGTCATVDPNP